ncbi:SseB family protein [Saccharopolyspora rectivirgula]|jgi:hypothetical protein|uniref:SseB family protein n=1 Tax=Saccharopolyspora rectivirgula TaxID=28042 RepID=UPI00041DC1F4|nr:SseB family protein [Saccharopolyspora rectivirgula]
MLTGPRRVVLGGTLPVGETAPGEAGGRAALLDAVWAVRWGRTEQIPRVVQLLRQMPELVVETNIDEAGAAVRTWQVEGARWLPVFTGVAQLAAHGVAVGRGDQNISYGLVSGRELLEQVWPQLPRGTGLLLDPAADHVLPLPPLAGVAPDEIALPRQRTTN